MTDPSQWPDSREFWKKKRVCVTGGAGFLGSFVVDKLRQHGAKDVFVPRHADYDLVQGDAIRRLLNDARPDVVIYLAALGALTCPALRGRNDACGETGRGRPTGVCPFAVLPQNVRVNLGHIEQKSVGPCSLAV